ncbi:MAG TPA: chitin deacetylase family protein [Streptosporangiaceae bacterium]
MSRRARRLGIAIAGLAAGGAGAVVWAPPNWLIDGLARFNPGCLYRVKLRLPLIALTIDDGPDPAATPRILAQLQRHQARATFFLISSRVAGREPLVRELVRAGHELGNHLTRDEPSIRLRPAEFERALLEAHRALAPFGPVSWIRPGSGWHSQAMVAIMRRHQYRCALGSVYPFDAVVPSAAFAARYILRNAQPGAVVILHDGGSRGLRTARVLREVLPELRRRGYQVVTLSELIRAA